MEKNKVIEIRIEDMLDDGRGFGRHEGFAVFIDGGIPGDLVKAEIAKVKKSSAEAKLIEIIELSPDRIETECPYANICGGCTLQELEYETQKELKRNNVIAKLTRIAGLDNPKVNEIIGAQKLKRYRNKATFAVGRHGEVGFLERKSNRIVQVVDCMIQTEPAMACAAVLRDFLKDYKISTIRQMIVKTSFATGEVMVVLESELKDIPSIEVLAGMLDEAVYSVAMKEPESGIDLIKTEFSTDLKEERYSLESIVVTHSGKTKILAGKNTIVDKIEKRKSYLSDNHETDTDNNASILKFEIGPQSFYQVNPEQMLMIYEKVEEYANLTGKETVLDIYCGVGTIGLFLADKAEKVVGIESVRQAVIDANRNSVINNIVNTRYICGKAEEELTRIIDNTKAGKQRPHEIHIDKVDVAILDPPRAGADQKLLDAVIRTNPSRIVYVSCDAGTLSRDIKYLTANGYSFVECTPVDQFPWTSHVETIALLQRVKS